MYCIIEREKIVSRGYEYMRTPFGFRQTAATQIINNPHNLRARSKTSVKGSFRSNNQSSKSPAIVRTIKTRPKANPACMLTHRIIKGASHQIDGVSSRREYRSKKLIKMLARRRENICGRTPQIGMVAAAPSSTANPET